MATHETSSGMPSKLRYLGVDAGDKRIGLALADAESGVVSPLCVLAARTKSADNARAIGKVAEEYAVHAIVVGLPLNMDGTEGPQARRAKSLAAALARGGDRPVHLHDERLTSHAADHRLADRRLTRRGRKARRDAVAAQVILESFLNRNG